MSGQNYGLMKSWMIISNETATKQRAYKCLSRSFSFYFFLFSSLRLTCVCAGHLMSTHRSARGVFLGLEFLLICSWDWDRVPGQQALWWFATISRMRRVMRRRRCAMMDVDCFGGRQRVTLNADLIEWFEYFHVSVAHSGRTTSYRGKEKYKIDLLAVVVVI